MVFNQFMVTKAYGQGFHWAKTDVVAVCGKQVNFHKTIVSIIIMPPMAPTLPQLAA